jgi:hypothetical protein
MMETLFCWHDVHRFAIPIAVGFHRLRHRHFRPIKSPDEIPTVGFRPETRQR